ncbi:MAG TPA: response regulator transcription factor [Acidimicrobiales bacterium]|nr:response regulator transcription factor [Acidimicrobiales bacterium]
MQLSRRLLREGVGQLLSAELDVEVVASATTRVELVLACQQHLPDVALIEVDSTAVDPRRVVAALRHSQPRLIVIGLVASTPTTQDATRGRRGGITEIVGRDTGIAGILKAVRAPNRAVPGCRQAARAAPSPSSPTLTGRELEVLSLVGAGLTSVAISSRLNISHKTVENHKQRIFAKLDVQNQAHAVSVAMRTGMLRPDRVMELASAGDRMDAADSSP